MKRSAVLVAFAAAGVLATAPAAFATDSPTATPTTSTTPTTGPTTTTAPPTSTTPTTEPPAHAGNPKAFLKLQPSAARPGDTITVLVGCEASGIGKLASPVLEFGALSPSGPQDDPAKAAASRGKAVVKKDAKPGKYPASFFCGVAEIATSFTVLGAQQVTQVPAGAPQTGGTDGPVEDGTPFAAAGALGVLAAGAAGCVLYRRRRAED
ncbi:hypothetical protein [Amycolatopsis samaneae]|uniref:Gram-positive cocci surface proteins LPxTG domain-containing protein n=1 Tax=Amycolatopsis samaneae TaxID=664691 RepID=A0ABW5GGS8_9PSEU